MIINRNGLIELEIGGQMKIFHGASMSDYIKGSQATAREVLQEDGAKPSDVPTGAREVVSELTR